MSVFELQTGDSISAFDAGFDQETLPDGAQADTFDTNGPSRFSIWIPSEHVTVNMGNPVFQAKPAGPVKPGAPPPTYTEEPGPMVVDGGFVAQTDHHIHFHTFGDVPQQKAGGPSRAVVRLGTPVTVVKASTAGRGVVNTNAIQDDIDIGSVYPPPYNSWDGYAMVTECGSFQESWGNNLIVSGNADVRVVGQRAVVIGSPSDVHIMADGQSAIAPMVGNTSNDGDIQGAGKWVDEQKAFKIFDGVMGGVSLGVTAFTTFWSLYGMMYSRPSEVGRPGWVGYCEGDANDTFNDLAGTAGSLLAPGAAVYAAYKAIKTGVHSGDPVTTGDGASSSITMYASSGISAVGSVSTSIAAGLFASVTGGVTASLGSNVATSVASLISTTVSGLSTSMSGMISASVSSMFGSATVTGKTKAQLSSWGKVFVSSNDDMQVNSVNANVYVHGTKGFYVGCGAGAAVPVKLGVAQTGVKYEDSGGYGIAGDPKAGITLGKLDFATVFKVPLFSDKVTNQSFIEIQDTRVRLQYKAADITIDDSGVTLCGKGGKRINLG